MVLYTSKRANGVAILPDFKSERLRDAASEVLSDIPSEGFLLPELNCDYSARTLIRSVHDMIIDGRSPYMRFERVVDGKTRDISVPHGDFQQLVKRFMLPFVSKTHSHSSSHGGENNWSPPSSLRTHLPMSVAFSLDLSNAVPSINLDRVFDFYHDSLDGGGLSDNDRFGVASNLAYLSTVKYAQRGERGLPVGSPLSNHLINRSLKPLDERIASNCSDRGMRYTRWIDDFTVSSPEVRDIKEFLGLLDVVESEGLRVSPTKTFYQRSSDGDIYLLGQIIINGNRLMKNSRDIREANKVKSLDHSYTSGIRASGDYSKWK